ncbi:UPF0545 protein C22orf39 homolog [Ctenocephalides felis]|uniref:UPF0545 protein C22orf39 homolog n=1 Tax=Ctenocephalides felis TaxID=7515 RepID=UPI000E6E2844|nr:UPF0545 protein C22orf39 homolog [Ctenocephalides felis]
MGDTDNTAIPEWMIRPCDMYDEEYDDCRSIKARFHQYFIFGKELDCEQWKTDYNNCIKYTKNNDLQAAQELIDSETNRRRERLKGHYGNTTWQKRKEPPHDWNKPLPEWLAKQNEHSYLEIRKKELVKDGNSLADRTFCVIM